MPADIYAHRGASKHAPENTMAAFSLAYEQEADGIETDVQLTKDHIPVLMHDERVNRTTGGKGYIKDFTFAQLQQLDAGSWFSADFAGSRIVSLDAFLEWIYDKPLHLNIELKNNIIDYNQLENIVYDRVTHYHLRHRTTLSTFNPVSAGRLTQLSQNIGTSLLISKRYRDLAAAAEKSGAEAVHIQYHLLSQTLVNKCHQKNIAVRVYTVNSPKRMVRSFAMGCDGIFTDIPELAVRYREL